MAEGTYRCGAGAEEFLLNGELRYSAEKLLSVGSAGPPGREHLDHLSLGRLIHLGIRIQKERDNDRSKVTSIRFVQILRDRIQQVERGKLEGWLDLDTN